LPTSIKANPIRPPGLDANPCLEQGNSSVRVHPRSNNFVKNLNRASLLIGTTNQRPTGPMVISPQGSAALQPGEKKTEFNGLNIWLRRRIKSLLRT
jgi:hypothetical protein